MSTAEFEGMSVIVTGGATGIGLQMATGLAEAGSNIVFTSIVNR